MKLKQPELFPHGYCLHLLSLDPSIQKLVSDENWNAVDQVFQDLTSPGGALFLTMLQFHDFSRIETMISIRDSANDWEEDGIWHDDGSRVFAFSLSLTIHADEVEGNLELRRKNEETSLLIPTPAFGTAILFLTGIHGYEHRTRAVKKGKRVILVGWCS